MQVNVIGRLLPKFFIYFLFILESNEEHIPMVSLVMFCFVCLLVVVFSFLFF